MEISVEKTGELEFRVRVSNGTASVYSVRLSPEFSKRFDVSPEEVVKKSFEFLLAREPKESILSSFDIPETIVKFFPNFEKEILS